MKSELADLFAFSEGVIGCGHGRIVWYTDFFWYTGFSKVIKQVPLSWILKLTSHRWKQKSSHSKLTSQRQKMMGRNGQCWSPNGVFAMPCTLCKYNTRQKAAFPSESLQVWYWAYIVHTEFPKLTLKWTKLYKENITVPYRCYLQSSKHLGCIKVALHIG